MNWPNESEIRTFGKPNGMLNSTGTNAVIPKTIARQRQFLIRQDRCHDARAGLVGMLGDHAYQRQRDRGRGHQQILPFPQLQPDLDGHLGETVEFDGID